MDAWSKRWAVLSHATLIGLLSARDDLIWHFPLRKTNLRQNGSSDRNPNKFLRIRSHHVDRFSFSFASFT